MAVFLQPTTGLLGTLLLCQTTLSGMDQLKLFGTAEQATTIPALDRGAALQLLDELLVVLAEIHAGDPAFADQPGDVEVSVGSDFLHVVAYADQELALAGGDPALDLGHVAEKIDLAVRQARHGQQHLGYFAHASGIASEPLDFTIVHVISFAPSVCAQSRSKGRSGMWTVDDSRIESALEIRVLRSGLGASAGACEQLGNRGRQQRSGSVAAARRPSPPPAQARASSARRTRTT